MQNTNTNDEYLGSLLKLQQDGRGAISAPSNWTLPPILEVETALDAHVKAIADLIQKNQNGNGRTAKWAFFVGAPGNGKSSLVGKICRELIHAGIPVTTDDGTPIAEIGEADKVPYLLKGKNKKKGYELVWFAQDASVVRSPFCEDPDPARELVDLLKSAWDEDISLIVCTNRGVIEAAWAQILGSKSLKHQPWAQTVRWVIVGERKEQWLKLPKGRACDGVSFSYLPLDNRSLFFSDGKSKSDAERLTARATDIQNWAACGNCDCADLCPFKANREYLASDRGSRFFCDLLSKTEVYSGQVLVFREFLALLSVLLAGCSRDYESESPCSWVKERCKDENYLSLLGRRIYQVIFSGGRSDGLENHVRAREEQLNALKEIDRACAGKPSVKPLSRFRKNPASNDLGLERLIGNAGIISELNPINGSLDNRFYSVWSQERPATAKDSILTSGLERKCFDVFDAISDIIEKSDEDLVSPSRWFKRWMGLVNMRHGVMAEEIIRNSKELDDFRIIAFSKHRTPVDKATGALIDQLEKELGRIMSFGQKGITLNNATTLDHRWVEKNLKVRIMENAEIGGVLLPVCFGKSGEASAGLSGRTYIKLMERVRTALRAECFPHEILSGIAGAQARAAARSQFYLETEDVTLKVVTQQGNKCFNRSSRGIGLSDDE